ncbi:MAG: hypothetical protein J6S85_19425 [Methanobrevibacter sp.]|nr:hypothetical protein [Methanobrevibacter sp.]
MGKIKIELSCQIINSWGEYEDGAYKEVDNIADALRFMDNCRLSGSPDCTWSSHYTMYENGKETSQGDWGDLRVLIKSRFGITGIAK